MATVEFEDVAQSASIGQVSITSVAAQILPDAAAYRVKATLRNIGSVDCYLNTSSAGTTSTGFLFKAGELLEWRSQTACYGITASSSTTVSYLIDFA